MDRDDVEEELNRMERCWMEISTMTRDQAIRALRWLRSHAENLPKEKRTKET